MLGHMKEAMQGTFFEKWLDSINGKWFETMQSKIVTKSKKDEKEKKRKKSNGDDGIDVDVDKSNNCNNPNPPPPPLPPPPPPPTQLSFPTRTQLTAHYVKNAQTGAPVLASSSSPSPTFSSAELQPTYHGDERNSLGCVHYSRKCKLRHPTTGALHTCRLCAEASHFLTMASNSNSNSSNSSSNSSNNNNNNNNLFDRYAVTEVMCMPCASLQPSGFPNCVHCQASFSSYHCRICNFYDDSDDKGERSKKRASLVIKEREATTNPLQK